MNIWDVKSGDLLGRTSENTGDDIERKVPTPGIISRLAFGEADDSLWAGGSDGSIWRFSL